MDVPMGRIGPRAGRDRYLGYARYYAGRDRTTAQEWNWLEDVCGGYYGASCGRPWLRMWFRPQTTMGSTYPPGVAPYGVPFGNTYTPWVQADGDGIRTTLPRDVVAAPHGAGGGGFTGLTIPWSMDEAGRVSINSSPLIDLLRVPCFAEWGPCPRWDGAYFFETRGSNVAGMTVSTWSMKSKDLGWTLGTKVRPGDLFDLLDSAGTAEFDRNGDPYRIWLFGGRDAAGGVSDQMWGSNLATVDALGYSHPVDSTGLPYALKNAVAPDIAKLRYDLSRVAKDGAWPAARVGAVLACTGQIAAGGGPCKENCPKLQVALGLEEPPDGVTREAGALVLVGGEGAAGWLDDIWIYEEQASWVRPAGAAPGDPGPWPSGWRRLGALPGVAGGLASAGAVQVGKTLWLVGGSTSAGLTADTYRIDLETGDAQRLPAVGAPGGRTTPAVALDFVHSSLLVFGGSDAVKRPLNDLWRIDLATGVWTRVVAPCTGSGCPPGGGRPSMFVAAPSGEINVIADRGLSTPSTVGWMWKEGGWESVGERRGDLSVSDCDGDDVPEPLYGLRCGQAGGGGFPDFGRMRCDGGVLACRAPINPGVVVAEHSMRELAAVAVSGSELLALRCARIEGYRVGPDGIPVLVRTIPLRRAGVDLAVAGGVLLVADAEGVSLYRTADGTLLSSVPTCGKGRRVFVDGPRAYVLSLLSVVALDISDPASPDVLQRIRLLVGPRGTRMHSCGDCSWFDRGADWAHDLMHGGAYGRTAAGFDDGLLFIHLLSGLHVLDVRDGSGPDLLAWVPVGFARDLRVEGRFVYGNRPGRRTWVVGGDSDAGWRSLGEHDVPRWVAGTVDIDDWTIRWEPGRLDVATRQ